MASHAGTIEFVDAERIAVRRDDNNELDEYKLLKFKRSNQGTCINQRPIVGHGEHVEEGEVIADGPSTELGRDRPRKEPFDWIHDLGRLQLRGRDHPQRETLMNDVLTSLHIVEYEAEARDTKLGPEEITRDIPNVGDDALKDLDEEGIIRVGAEVESTDILVGKVTPKGENDLSAEERLLRAIFGEKSQRGERHFPESSSWRNWNRSRCENLLQRKRR